MTLTQVLLDEAEATYQVLEKLIRQVSDEELPWQPAEGRDWMSMGQLLLHCTSFGCGKAVRGFITGQWPADVEQAEADAHVPAVADLAAVASVREALALLKEDHEVTLSCISAAGDSNLLTRRVVAPWGGRELSLFEQLLAMIKHLAQHKGQLFYYLKLMGKRVDSHDLWGE